MAFFFSAASVGSTYDTPVNAGALAHGADPVLLTLSDGTIQNVFDSKTTALALMKSMRSQKSWMVFASEDVMIVAVSFTKLLVCQTSLVNQKLFSYFCPIYCGGQTRFVHRTASLVLSLSDALRAVGLSVQGTLETNADLAASNMLCVDWNYAGGAGTVLDDGAPLALVLSS